ncbi:hypothetical protein M3Y99_00796900 [Aphelenchoides fujianensis]|nr:hypothetical protein M3Y99_00796900 [Aphelenchoides fujianensis]
MGLFGKKKKSRDGRKEGGKKRKGHKKSKPAAVEPRPDVAVEPQGVETPRPSFSAFIAGQRRTPQQTPAPPPVARPAAREPPEFGSRAPVQHLNADDDATRRDTTLKCIEGLLGFVEQEGECPHASPHFSLQSAVPTSNAPLRPVRPPRSAPRRGAAERAERLAAFARLCVESEIPAAARVFAAVPTPGAPLTHATSDRHPQLCRFDDVHCIDQSRVVLRAGEGADFVHANRLPLDAKRQLIVAQLPTAATAAHFWRMVAHEGAAAVLLILTRHEWEVAGRGEGVLPESGCLHLDNGICVIVQQETALGPHVQLFTLRLLADGEARLVHFYHYTDWPHELAPNNSEDVWQLHSALRKSKGPVVCVSLSGCGRAGTYAALELLNARLNAPDAAELSVAQAVEAVRRVRFGAVQSPQQLSFVGLVLMDRLLVGRKTKALVPADVQAAYLELKPAAYERISADEPPADEF